MSKNLLNQLVKTKKPAAATKPDRPSVDVPDVVLKAFERLVGANAVLEVAEARKEVEAGLVNEEMLDLFAESLFKFGSTPANPKLQTEHNGRPDMTGIFQVQNRFKFNIPEDVNGDTDITNRLVFALESVGMGKVDALKLVEGEIDAAPVVTLRPFGELVNGHYEGEGKNKTFVEASDAEKAVGQKLLEFVTGTSAEPLTEDERNIAVRIVENIKVKEGFLQRLKGYCATKDVLRGVLKVITPVHFVSHMKLGVSDTPEQRQARLKLIAADLIGSETVAAKKAA
jgi:hypothetical protein